MSLLASALAVAADPSAPTTPVASSTASDEPIALGIFTVTGSYLDRSEASKTLPVTIISAEDIRRRGLSTPGEWLATLPQASRVPITESQASGADARGDIATVSLRGLGSGNTLVLLNGRRLAPHPISMPEGNSGVPSIAANVNVLPGAAIERIEVLHGGASALYGTDATAGVINAILRRDSDGSVVGIRFLDTQHGGGTEYRATFAGGRSDDRGRTSLAFSYGYFCRAEIAPAQREFSRRADFRSRAPAPWNGTTPDLSVDQRADRGFYGRFQRGAVDPSGTVAGSRPAGVTPAEVTGNGTFYFVPTAPGAASRTWQATEPDRSVNSAVGGYYLDVNEFRFLLPATQRHNFSVSLDQKLSDDITWFAEATYYRADSQNQREPSRIDAIADNNITVAIDNPYNPVGSRFYSSTGAPNSDGTPRLAGLPSAVVISRLSLPEFGARRIEVRSENVRFVTGLRGMLTQRWNWESALLYAAAKTTDREFNAIKESELRDALANTAPATALNPFLTTFAVVNGALTPSGAPFTNPESVVAPLRGTFYREGKTSLASWDFRVNGPIAELPAGPLRLAAGGEYRRETYVDFRDAESGRLTAAEVQHLGLRAALVGNNNYLQVSPSDNTDARRTVQAAFVEMVAPIYGESQRAALRSLEFFAAARFERSTDFGHTTKPKIGLAARVLPWAMVRASVNEAFRAPNLAALFSGAMQRSITRVSDGYRAAVTASPDDGPTARRVSLRTGNTTLAPEKARTTTAGVLFEPPGLKGLTLSIDAWKIEQTDALTRFNALDILAQDTALLTAASTASAPAPIDTVDLSTAGSPNVLRNPITAQDRAAFAAYNAGRPRGEQRAAVGTIRAIAESYVNASCRELAGIDLALNYRVATVELGAFDATVEAAYLAKFEEQLIASAPRTNLSWRDGNTRWKGSLALAWKKGKWAAGIFTTYTGRTQDSFIRTNPTFAGPGVSPDGFLIVGESWLTNLSVTRHFDDAGLLGRASVRLGVNNIFDAEPPFGLGANSDSDGYLRGFGDPRGRAFSVELTKRW